MNDLTIPKHEQAERAALPEALSLAQALVRCPSVTPAEGGALALIAGWLSEAGFRVERHVFSEGGTPDIENLWAVIGHDGPTLVFAGHTDVVPPGDTARWSTPPFAGTVVDGKLIARGAEDMKGGVAAMLAATFQHLATHGVPAKGRIAFLITGDEEGPAINGTVKLLAWARARGERLDHCILGEPTSQSRVGDTLKIGRRGSLTCTLTVEGRQGHVGYPDKAINPIQMLGRLIVALADTPLDAGTEHFGPSTLAFSTADVGNPTQNVIPQRAVASFNVRFNDLWTPQTLAAELTRRCAAVDIGGATATLTPYPTNAVSFRTLPGRFTELLSAAIAAETGITPALSTTGGTSDARFIKDYAEVVEIGLVGRSMHQIDEHLVLDELETLTRVYARAIQLYFAG
jgi:succinyl-diaminopimelate desuccinylase